MKTKAIMIVLLLCLLNYMLCQWTRCAKENETCSFNGLKIVRFGNFDGFNYIEATNTVKCNSATFGIPSSNPIKFCDFADSLFSYCSNLGSLCYNLEYTPALIKFSNGLQNVYRKINYAEALYCLNTSFGAVLDPQGKSCYKSALPFDDEY